MTELLPLPKVNARSDIDDSPVELNEEQLSSILTNMNTDQAEIDNMKFYFMNVANAISAKIYHNQYAAVFTLAGHTITDVEFEHQIKRVFRESTKITWHQVLQSVKELQQRRKARNEKQTMALDACRVYDTHGNGLIAEDDLMEALWNVNITIDCETLDCARKEELASSDPMVNYKDFIEELDFTEYC